MRMIFFNDDFGLKFYWVSLCEFILTKNLCRFCFIEGCCVGSKYGFVHTL